MTCEALVPPASADQTYLFIDLIANSIEVEKMKQELAFLSTVARRRDAPRQRWTFWRRLVTVKPFEV